MQGSQLTANRAFRASKPHNGAFRAPIAAQRCKSRGTVQVNAFFNFLQPKQAAAGTSPKARELAQELLEIASQTRPGTAVPPVTKAEIEELVAELEPLCMKNPLKSPLLWGTYEVVYCSKPSAVGGPLTKGAGPVVAAGQQARQILQEPGTLVNEVTFKTLGLLPGFSRQYGQIQPLSGDTFLLSIKEGEISTGPVKQSKSFDIERKIKIVYLDEDLRIARFLPSDDLADSEQESAEGGPEEEEILFVFQRVAEGEEEEEVAEEEEEQERPTSPIANLFGGTRKVESLATQAERRVQEQRTRKGTQPFFIGGRSRDAEEEEEEQEDPRAARARAQAERRAAQEQAKQEAAAARSADQARAAKERERAEREKEAERARAQREKEAEARARAQQEAREAAEAEKAARAERQGQIRELLAELSDELKGAQGEAREAAKEAREVARDNQAVLKQVSAAEAAIAEAERDVQQVSAALEEAIAARKNVEQQVKAAQQSVRDAEAAYKQKVGAR